MNPIIRNFRHVIRRFKLATALNVLGLSVAFAAFMIIMMQLNYNFSFGKHHDDWDKIFRVEMIRGGAPIAAISRPVAEHFFASSPHIVAGGLNNVRGGRGRGIFGVHINDEMHQFFVEYASTVSHGFFDVFTFDFVEGSIEEMAPGNIVIPLSFSRRMFGYESAIGRQVFHHEYGPQTVIAVYRDFPSNALVDNHVYFVMQPHDFMNYRLTVNQVFIRVNRASNATSLIDSFKRSFDGRLAWGEGFDWEESGRTMRLTALPDIRFIRDVENDYVPKENRQTLMILFVLGILTIVIAAVNFTNFSTALMPMRVRNINTQRVMGAQRSTIRWMLVIEAIIFCLVSYLAALLLVKLLGVGVLETLIDADLSFAANPAIVIGTALLAIVVGVCAGLYPSFYITSFAPALALKGNFGLSPKGKRIRNTLISIQFVASMVLIVLASFIHLQNRLMQNADLGFNADGLITVDMSGMQGMSAFEIRDSGRDFLLSSHPGITEVSFARSALMSADQFVRWERPYEGRNIVVELFSVHYNFLEMMGVDITEGRDFRRDDAESTAGVLIFNETARRQFDMELGTTFMNAEIIGFASDIHFSTFRVPVQPMAFSVQKGMGWQTAYIRMAAGADRREVASSLLYTLTGGNPSVEAFSPIRFFDEVLQQTYERELALGRMVLIFSLMVIFISIMGVFGLVVFDSECRRKEIGIRKVMGATSMEIITMFNKAYIKILAICFVIAVPLAWLAVNRWLENFAYRTPIYWWVFVLAFLAVAMITVLTVTIQNWRVANEDPVKSIKTE